MKEDRVYLKHIRHAIIQIKSYTVDGRDSFFHNSMIQRGRYRVAASRWH
jgi:uncharacterized protein with HEPN domain